MRAFELIPATATAGLAWRTWWLRDGLLVGPWSPTAPWQPGEPMRGSDLFGSVYGCSTRGNLDAYFVVYGQELATQTREIGVIGRVALWSGTEDAPRPPVGWAAHGQSKGRYGLPVTLEELVGRAAPQGTLDELRTRYGCATGLGQLREWGCTVPLV